ncbi:MAG: nitroreductase family protein, partial [Dehalococcoidia bacterium]
MSDGNVGDDMGLFEAVHTQRAIRRFKPDPVPDDVVSTILEAATKAPSGGNGQPWQFLILRDAEIKRQIGAIYQDVADEYAHNRGPLPASRLGPPTPMGEAPLLVLVCRRTLDPPIATSTPSLYASIYPAVQNMLLAARALGVGSVLTTLHIRRESDVKALLGIPDDVETCALIPMGYPRGN